MYFLLEFVKSTSLFKSIFVHIQSFVDFYHDRMVFDWQRECLAVGKGIVDAYFIAKGFKMVYDVTNNRLVWTCFVIVVTNTNIDIWWCRAQKIGQ